MPLDNSWFILSHKLRKIKNFKNTNVRFPQALPEKFILKYSKIGDIILDPFAGFGTTLFAAEKLGRIGIGIEYDKKRVAYIKSRLKGPSKIIFGDSLRMNSLKLPKIDFCFTSPPYMGYFDKKNPLTNYTKTGNYKNYLSRIDKIYSQIKKIMKKGGYLIIEVANISDKKHPITPLAWDIGKIVSKHFYFERDFMYCFKNKKLISLYDNDNHSYCLAYKNNG